VIGKRAGESVHQISKSLSDAIDEPENGAAGA
jgi:hypothetical protein